MDFIWKMSKNTARLLYFTICPPFICFFAFYSLFSICPPFFTFYPVFVLKATICLIIRPIVLEDVIILKCTDMMCSYVTDCLTENGTIREEEKEIYSYCFGFLADLIFYNLSILLIGLLLGKFHIALLYVLMMTPTKMMAGGMHAPTPVVCDIVSYGVFFIALLLIPGISIKSPPFLLLTIYFLCYIFIVTLSPVDTKNKRYAQIQKRRLKKYCFIYLTAMGILYAMFYVKEMSVCCGTISVCSAIILLNQIIGIVMNTKERYYDLKNRNL